MTRGLKIGETIVGTLLGVYMLLAGAQKFLARAAFEQVFEDFGLPVWSVPLVGVAEIVGAVLVLIPRTALYGAGLIGAVMLGAVGSHLLSGVGTAVPAFVALLMAVAVAAIRLRAARTSS